MGFYAETHPAPWAPRPSGDTLASVYFIEFLMKSKYKTGWVLRRNPPRPLGTSPERGYSILCIFYCNSDKMEIQDGVGSTWKPTPPFGHPARAGIH
jgi:hypothetical protein